MKTGGPRGVFLDLRSGTAPAPARRREQETGEPAPGPHHRIGDATTAVVRMSGNGSGEVTEEAAS